MVEALLTHILSLGRGESTHIILSSKFALQCAPLLWASSPAAGTAPIPPLPGHSHHICPSFSVHPINTGPPALPKASLSPTTCCRTQNQVQTLTPEMVRQEPGAQGIGTPWHSSVPTAPLPPLGVPEDADLLPSASCQRLGVRVGNLATRAPRGERRFPGRGGLTGLQRLGTWVDAGGAIPAVWAGGWEAAGTTPLSASWDLGCLCVLMP